MTKNFDWEKHLIECMESTTFLALSTISDEGSWTNPVYFSYDEEFNIYFISKPESKHMQNIKKNEKVSLAIFSTKFKANSNLFGIQMVGKAAIISDGDIDFAFSNYYGRKFGDKIKNQEDKPKDFKGNSEWKFVKIKPENIYYFDTRYFGEVRQKVPEEIYRK